MVDFYVKVRLYLIILSRKRIIYIDVINVVLLNT